MQITTATPVEIDTALAAIHGEIYRARHAVAVTKNRLAATIAGNAKRTAGNLTYSCYTDESVSASQRAYDKAVAAYDELVASTAPYDAEFLRRGGWTRAFLVVTNGTGHVHRSTRCGTCFDTTEFAWLPEMSGQDESEIVDAAGERACTICYPSAPVETLSRPTRLFSADERSKAEARADREAARAAKAAAKAAKSITMPDGSPLKQNGWAVESERTAEIEYVDDAAYLLGVEHGYPAGRVTEARRYVDDCLTALAAKHGTDVATERTRLAAKVTARARRDYGVTR